VNNQYTIVKKQDHFYFLENGQPQLLMAGEVHNSSASTSFSMDKNVWPYVVDIGLNTLLVPVYWEDIEKEPNKYTFDLIDDHLEKAALYDVKIIFLWFGLWKNGLSTYVPSWVKTATTEYYRVVDHKDERINCISPFCEKAVAADCKALSAFSEYLSKHRLKNQVCMLQIQNEVGCLTSRDHSEPAKLCYQEALPKAIKELFPAAECWTDLSDEIFMAYAFSSALEKMAQQVKKWLPIPLFTNAWIQKEGKKAGEYPSGGPTKAVLPVWQKIATSLNAFAPDIYEENYAEIIEDYQSIPQPLLIPETRKDLKYMSNILYAFGKGAILYAPFGIEDISKDEEDQVDEDYAFLKQLGLEKAAFNPAGSFPYLKKCYALIRSLGHVLLDETSECVPFKKENDEAFVYQDEAYQLTIKYLSTSDSTQLNSAGFFFKQAGSYYFVGCNIAILHQAVDGKQRSEILQLEEGHFTNGQWIVERVLNGDERYTPYIGNQPKIIKFSLYSYKK
jgi:hypothetical protein